MFLSIFYMGFNWKKLLEKNLYVEKKLISAIWFDANTPKIVYFNFILIHININSVEKRLGYFYLFNSYSKKCLPHETVLEHWLRIL